MSPVFALRLLMPVRIAFISSSWSESACRSRKDWQRNTTRFAPIRGDLTTYTLHDDVRALRQLTEPLEILHRSDRCLHFELRLKELHLTGIADEDRDVERSCIGMLQDLLQHTSSDVACRVKGVRFHEQWCQ